MSAYPRIAMTSTSVSATTLDAPASPIAGFWQRIGACLVDGIILGIVGQIIAWSAYTWVVSLGTRGRLIGLAVMLPYLAVMNSSLCGGQTLGKRLLGIRVVNGDGDTLGLGMSLLRATLLCVPFLLNGAPIDLAAVPQAVTQLVSVAVFGFGFGIVYLYLFNRRTRQGLHDLIAGSFVVAAGRKEPPSMLAPVWPPHKGVVVAIMIASFALPFFTQKLATSPFFANLLGLQQAVMADPAFRYASVNDGMNKFYSSTNGSSTTHVLSVRAFLAQPDQNTEPLADRVARIVLEHASTNDEDMLNVIISEGYDIGIASGWRNQSYRHSPSQWRERLGIDKPAGAIPKTPDPSTTRSATVLPNT